jgi:hypothetical protein
MTSTGTFGDAGRIIDSDKSLTMMVGMVAISCTLFCRRMHYLLCKTLAQFFSHFFCRLLSKQPTDLSAALEAADKSVGCFRSSGQKK